MSARYDFLLICDLKPDIPENIIDVLNWMILSDHELFNPPTDKKFANKIWQNLLQVNNEWITQIPGDGIVSLRRVPMHYHNPGEPELFRYTFTFRNQVHGDSIMTYIDFAEWLRQYSDSRGFVGYYRSQDFDYPGLMYFWDDKFEVVDINLPRTNKP